MNNQESLKDKTAKGMMWGGLSNGLMQVLGAIFGIVMLKILDPGDYGKIAVLLVYSNIASNLQESGFISALCNKKEPKHEDYNAVFWFNIIVSVCIYILLFFASPLIAEFNHDPALVPLARFLFLGFLISAFGTVQRAYLFGHMMVKQKSLIEVVALIISNIIGLTMALNDYAYWGLATQSVTYVIIVMALDWYVSPWRPSFKINLRPAWEMFGFSSKLLITNLFNQFNSQAFSFLLGHYYSDNGNTVGQYSNARKWNDMASNTINGMVTSVAQPVLTQVRDDDERYRTVFRKMLRFVSFVSFPCMLGLALIAHEFVLLIDKKWEDSAFLLSMLCVYGAFVPITTLYSNLTISRGKSGINMFCTIALCILVWIGLIACRSLGIYAMVVYFISINLLWLFVWHWFAWRLIRLPLLDVLKDVIPFLLFATGVMAATWYLTRTIDSIYIALIAKILIAAVLYIGLTYISGAKIMRESIDYITKKKK